ncbi:uncharacterized protein [Ptychodera flava]|uniref:uncharacterized protein isoform X1 n=1 Tax=Ptychodera flava TaxID=63121 RepID=UPI00396A57FD
MMYYSLHPHYGCWYGDEQELYHNMCTCTDSDGHYRFPHHTSYDEFYQLKGVEDLDRKLAETFHRFCLKAVKGIVHPNNNLPLKVEEDYYCNIYDEKMKNVLFIRPNPQLLLMITWLPLETKLSASCTV